MASAGRVLLMPKGTWTAGTTYNELDFVYYGGNSYVCKAAVSGSVDPTNDSTHWQQMASGFDSDLITQTIMNDPNHIASDAAVYAECQKLETVDDHFRADLAHVEEAGEASIVYHAGDYLMYDDQLYKATAAIAIGDTLSTATNIRAVTVGEQLADLATAGSANTAAISKHAADLAVLSTSPTTRSFAVGEYLMYNNQLYRVTQAIASGGTLTVGTNIVAANVGAQLKTLNDSLTTINTTLAVVKTVSKTGIAVAANSYANVNIDLTSNPPQIGVLRGFSVAGTTDVIPLQVYISTDNNSVVARLRNISTSNLTAELYVWYK